MIETKDKRVAPREPVHFVAEIELQGQRIGCGISRDASGAGLLLLTDVEPPVGSSLVLILYIPHEEEPRVLDAAVVRCEKIPATEGVVWPYRVGVRLENPPPDLQQIVERLTKRRSSLAPPL